MALSTLTLDQYFAQTDPKLRKRGDILRINEAAVEQVTEAKTRRTIRQRINRARRFVDQLFSERDAMELQKAQAKNGQTARFAAVHGTPWDEHFMRVNESDEQNPGVRFGAFKRMQECFSSPDLFTAARTEADLKQYDIDGILIDMEAVPDDLCVKLGLAEFTEDDSPVERWKMKHTPEMIERLRSIIKGTHVLHGGNQRIHVLPDNRILYNAKNGDSANRDRKLQVFESGYAASRKTGHEQCVYENETRILEDVKIRLAQVTERLNDYRHSTPQAEKARIEAEVSPLLVGCADDLAAAINVFKRLAGDTLEGMDGLTSIRQADNRPIKNPSAAMAKLVKVRNVLVKRFGEMVEKGKANTEDGMLLHQEIVRSEAAFNRLRAQLSGVTTANLNAVCHPRTLRPITAMRVRPFTTFAEKIYSIATPNLASEHPEDRISGLVRIAVVAKFQEVNRRFEEIRKRMLAYEHLSVADVAGIADELAQSFQKIDVFPEHREEAYVAPYEMMRDEILKIQQRLHHYCGQPMTDGERKEMYNRLRAYLDRFDPEEEVRKLP